MWCCSFTDHSLVIGNNTYFVSQSGDSSPCTFNVCRSSSDICQIRLNFDTFQISGPVTTVTSGPSAVPNSRTQCLSAQFTASQDGPQPPVLCGTNSGYHMILDADMNCNSLTFSWSSTTDTRSWNIHISEILCSDPHKPPQGCLQYFTGITHNFCTL